MVNIMENPIRMDDLGGFPPFFGNTIFFFAPNAVKVSHSHQGNRQNKCPSTWHWHSCVPPLVDVEGLEPKKSIQQIDDLTSRNEFFHITKMMFFFCVFFKS